MIAGKDLAPRLGVTPAALSAAVSRGHYCGGHDVGSWAVYSESGRVRGYDVPAEALADLGAAQRVVRANPAPLATESTQSTPSTPVSAETPASQHIQALLPPGEDYRYPVAAAGASHVLGLAVAHDTPTGRALVLCGSGLGGGAIAYEICDKNPWAFLLGGAISAGVAAFGLGLIGQKGQAAGQGAAREVRPQGGVYTPRLPAANASSFAGGGDGSRQTSIPPVVALSVR